VPAKPNTTPLTPKESLARGCLLVVVWLLVLVIAGVFTLSRAHFAPITAVRDAGPRPRVDAGPVVP
jgi:hypothetical protein